MCHTKIMKANENGFYSKFGTSYYTHIQHLSVNLNTICFYLNNTFWPKNSIKYKCSLSVYSDLLIQLATSCPNKNHACLPV